jgi:hypothetical protein
VATKQPSQPASQLTQRYQRHPPGSGHSLPPYLASLTLLPPTASLRNQKRNASSTFFHLLDQSNLAFCLLFSSFPPPQQGDSVYSSSSSSFKSRPAVFLPVISLSNPSFVLPGQFSYDLPHQSLPKLDRQPPVSSFALAISHTPLLFDIIDSRTLSNHFVLLVTSRTTI